MAFLIVDGEIIPVEYPDGASQEAPEEVGDSGRAVDGTYLSSIRDWKRSWPFRTKWISRAAADTVISALQGPPPLPCSGDALGGAVNCIAKLRGEDIGTFADGVKVRVKFELHEA